MDARAIDRHAAALGCAGALVAALLAGGCVDDPPPQEEPVDARPSDVAVRGTATGVVGPVALELRFGDEVERLTVSQDGPFAFETRLQFGRWYSVVFADQEPIPCTLRYQGGLITGAEDQVIELTCTGASLESLFVSGIAQAIALVPGTTAYEVELPLLQQSVTVTATVAMTGDSLTIAGTPAESGAPSAPITLNLGDNPIDIVVETFPGWQRTYRLTLRRAAEIAQYGYGKASNAGADDLFGVSVALSGDTLAVGAQGEASAATGVDSRQDDDLAPRSGAVYVFRRYGSVWHQEAYIKASNTGADDYFGTSVALSGDTLAVGAWLEDSAATGVGGSQDNDDVEGSGAVYVFRRIGTNWSQEAYVKASNTGADDFFGISVALSGDTLAVGAVGEDSAAKGVDGDQNDNDAPDSGAVYVFRRAGTVWQQEAYIKASNTDGSDNFGTSVALSGDVLAVGAEEEDSAATGVGGNEDSNVATDSGAVYVFRRTDMTWQQEAYVKASNTDADDEFGISVALSGDTLAVGAWGEDSAATGVGGNQDDNGAVQSGAAYVFRYNGTAWQQEAYVKASNTDVGDAFGFNVALSGDSLAVGAWGEDSAATGGGSSQDDEGASSSGAAYMFRRAGAAWQQEAYLKASNTDADDEFGRSVAVSGAIAAVGARYEDWRARDSGAVYIFH